MSFTYFFIRIAKNKQHGIKSIANNNELLANVEVGNSISIQGQRAIITGFVTSCNVNPFTCAYQDILFMSVNIFDGSIIVSFRYDIQQKLDVGQAIEWFSDVDAAFIAGGTETQDILGSGSSNDIFLLELDSLGSPRKLELFGTAKTSEFNVDLTRTNDFNALMLSNTPFNHMCTDSDGPWLIERYDDVDKQCRDAVSDVTKNKVKMVSKNALQG